MPACTLRCERCLTTATSKRVTIEDHARIQLLLNLLLYLGVIDDDQRLDALIMSMPNSKMHHAGI